MKRSPMPPRKREMKCNGFVRAERIDQRDVTKMHKGLTRATRIKSSGPKMTPIRKAARGQDCTIQLPGVCNGDAATTVLCHSNSLADGKGMGLKAPDTAAAFGCSTCHAVLDGQLPRPAGMTKDDVEAAFRAGVERTHQYLRTKGLIE